MRHQNTYRAAALKPPCAIGPLKVARPVAPVNGVSVVTGSHSVTQGRGALSNTSGRFERYTRDTFDDGWGDGSGNSPYDTFDDSLAESLKPVRIPTEITPEAPRTIISKNQSPDIPFDRSINPYRGCEHGCIYCFARPTHTYMGLSAGLDFETKLFSKSNAAELLRKELMRPNYIPAPIAMGTNTDPYQPIEKTQKITRQILEVLAEFDHPVTILTKNRMIVRDLDILTPMAEKGLARVAFSITTLDSRLSRLMEPRASSPQRRLDAMRIMTDMGIDVGMMFAPVIPAINDHEMEQVLAASAHAGATSAAYILLRLPREIETLFREWLLTHFPDRANRVMNRLLAMRAGRANDPRFGHRMKGKGVEADLMKARFTKIAARMGLLMNSHRNKDETMNVHDFLKTSTEKRTGGQLSLF